MLRSRRKEDVSLRGGQVAMSRWILIVSAAALLASCTRGPEYAELGRQFLLLDEPTGAMGVIDYHEADPKPSDVTLVGRVGLKNLKWSSQSAMFMLIDPTESMEGGEHV